MKRLIRIPALLGTALLLAGCTGVDTASRGGGGGTGSEVAGIVYAPDSTRAANALVRVMPVGYVPDKAAAGGFVDSTVTDSLGRYGLGSLASGTYNLFFSRGGDAAYRASLTIATAADTLRDTLAAPGSLTAIVGLQPGDDPRTVQVLVLGSVYRADPDSTGRFTLANLARGIYPVRFLPSLDVYKVKDTTLQIFAGKDVTLKDTIWLQYTGGLAVQGLTLSYDSLKEIVSLSWQPLDSSTVKGYNIYRANADSMLFATPLAYQPAALASFADSFAVQGRRYVYRVRVVDTAGKESQIWEQTAPVTITSAYRLVREFGGTGSDSGKFNIPVGIVVKDGKIFVAEQGNKRIQELDTMGKCLRIFGDTGGNALTMPLEMAEHNGLLYVADNGSAIMVFDTGGKYEKQIDCSLYAVTDLAVADSDSICVVANIQNTVVRINGSGAQTAIANYSFAPGRATKILLANSEVLVSGGQARDVVFFDEGLTFKSKIALPVAATGSGNCIGAVTSIGAYAGFMYADAQCTGSTILEIDPATQNLVSRFQVCSNGNTPVQERDLVIDETGIIFLTTTVNTVQIVKQR